MSAPVQNKTQAYLLNSQANVGKFQRAAPGVRYAAGFTTVTISPVTGHFVRRVVRIVRYRPAELGMVNGQGGVGISG